MGAGVSWNMAVGYLLASVYRKILELKVVDFLEENCLGFEHGISQKYRNL